MQQLHKSQQLDVICTQVLFISQVLEVLTLCALASLTLYAQDTLKAEPNPIHLHILAK